MADRALAGRFHNLEVGLARLHLESMRKVRDDLLAESRSLGPKSPDAKEMREALAAMELMVSGLEKLLAAAEADDDGQREEARQLMQQAGERLESLE